MQRFVFALIASALSAVSALAGPLTLDPDHYASPLARVGAPRAAPTAYVTEPQEAAAPAAAAVAPEPQPPATRVAFAQRSNLGGGFIEFLFGGGRAGRQAYAPRTEPAPLRPIEPYVAPRYVRGEPAERTMPMDAAAPAQRAMDPRFLKQVVAYNGKEKPGTIIINTPERMLYLVQEDGKALRYGIGVGRPGFTWSGVKKVSQKREWPDWRPPKEMLQRRPDLPRFMPGGPQNPLGARAMYLGSSLYRIHGSNEPWTIGHAVSSGCIRMRNEDVIDLYQRVTVGTKVVVI
jgi:lipoprotein-anchoring transpeptidase ErfK/SrfK